MLRYAITDRGRFPISEAGDEATRQAALLRQAGRLAATGIDFLQLREKNLEPAALAHLARTLLVTLRTQTPAPRLLINSRADVAIAIGADGVHLTSAPGSLTSAEVRRLYASTNLPEPVVSVSCHTPADVARARAAAPSLILFGPVFEKVILDPNGPTAAEILIAEGSGLDLLHLACSAAAPIPVLALGGITHENTPACLAAGAAGIASIRLYLLSN